MDELTVMRSFRAERVEQNPTARAAARRALEARFDSARAAGASSVPPRPGGLFFGRRRLLAFAGASAIAVALAGIVVLSSSPTTQPAAAEVLRHTAALAAEADAPTEIPGPGQFLYRKFNRVELKGWVPGGEPGGPSSNSGGEINQPDAFNGLESTTQEEWLAPDGAGRERRVAGTPQFFSSQERSRWEAAGSPLPVPFDLEYQKKYRAAFREGNPELKGFRLLELGKGVADTENPPLAGFHFPDTSSLPTEPKALQHAVEDNTISVRGFNLMYPSAKHLDSKQTSAELINILLEGESLRPQLRAAIFDALAELPGIEVNTNATDSLGRHGYAISSIDPKTGGGEEFIFDPDTSEILAKRWFTGDHGGDPSLKGVPAGTTISETAYLETGVVDSTHETSAEAEAAGPSPAQQRSHHGRGRAVQP